MTYIMKPEVNDYITDLRDLMALRKMRPIIARQYLEQHYPSMPIELIDDVIAMVESVHQGHTQAPLVTTKQLRSYFVAASWLAGASWGQLSKMFQVARSTLARSVERKIGYGIDRQMIKVNRLVTYERLEAMWNVFIAMSNETPALIYQTKPLDLGEMLWAESGIIGNETDDDPISGMSVPDRKMPTPSSD